jgi:Uma2 family endonuclease
MASAVTTKLTYGDYVELPNDGKRYEIIDGKLCVNLSPARKHQIATGNLYAWLWNYTRREHVGSVYVAPFDVVLSDSDIVQPDVVFITNAHRERVTERGVVGAPDLVIEVLSPASRKSDEGLKRKRYDLYGVHEYWIVDPDAETVTIYRRNADALERVETPEPITSPLLPGFALDVREVFAE